MNFTRPDDLERDDLPEDWLASALVFTGALGHTLRVNEGVCIKVTEYMKSLFPDYEKVIVYHGEDKMIHIVGTEEDIPDGGMIWYHKEE